NHLIFDQKTIETKEEKLISDDDNQNNCAGMREELGHEEDDGCRKIDINDSVHIVEVQKLFADIKLCDTEERKYLASNEQLEELNLLQRKELKALKKRQREQKKKDQSDKFKKFLRGQLSEQEKNALIQKQKINSFKEDIKIVFDKNAQDQWIGLNAFERNKVSELIADIKIGGKRGKPEKLQNSDIFSRRITEKHRLVYKIVNNGDVNILSCKDHYDD
ncbi:MAG: type II toxin-antitoxin system YoeB family toxin, partial [Alphaproteobacteria bacterium]|nr:type II toxin-antitoxin system YoeB family toxin [Alphaproteobacteria bacterium]